MANHRIQSFSIFHQTWSLICQKWASLLFVVPLLGVTVSIPGFFFVLNKQFVNLVGDPSNQQQLTIFVQQAAGSENVEGLLKNLENMADIESIRLMNREQALNMMRQVEGVELALNYLDGNPFLDTISVIPSKVLERNRLDALKQKILSLRWVESVYLDIDWSVTMSQFSLKLQYILIMMSVVSLLVVLILIFNFTSLRISANEVEVRVKIMLGAYPWRIYQPYFFLGILIGLLTGIISTLCIYGLYWYTMNFIDSMIDVGVLRSDIVSDVAEIVWVTPICIFLGFVTTAVAFNSSYKKIMKKNM